MPGDASRLQPVERLLMLLAIPEFETLGPPELRRLADAAVLTQHAAGVALGHREPPNAVEIVVEGLVELRAESGELRRLGPRDVVGSLRQVLSGAPPTSAMALVDTLTLRLDAEALEDLLEEEFGIFTAVLRGLTRSLLDRLPLPRAAFSEDSAWVAPGRELDLVERMLLMRRTLMFGVARMDVLAELAQQAQPFARHLGAPLFRTREAVEHFIVLASGSVHCASDGEAAFVGPPLAIGMLESVAGLPRRFTATAASEVRGLEIPGALFIDLVEDYPQLGLDLLRGIAKV